MYSTLNGPCTNPLNVATKKDSITKAIEHPINDTMVVDSVKILSMSPPIATLRQIPWQKLSKNLSSMPLL